MKRLIYILPLVVFAIACNNRTAEEKLVAIDSLVVQELYDSAYTVLTGIDTTLLNDMETRAHYYLLLVQTSRLIDHPLSSDSLLDIVINYYQDGTDATKLSDAYYYKAVGLYQKAAPKEVILYLKKAEKQAERSGNIRQQYKISEGISFINDLYGNYDIQLEYAKKMLTLSKVINNKRWIADAYFRASLAYSNLGITDSIKICTDKLSPYIKYVREKDLPYFLSGIGFVYKESNPNIAKNYFQRALSLKEMPMALSSLAEICYDEGNKQEAYHLWQRALATDDPMPKDNIIQNLIEYEIETGKIDSISDRVNEIIAIRDSVESKIKNSTIRNLQLNFDHEVEMNAAHERLIRWQRALGIIAFLALCLIGYILWRKHKARLQRLENELLTKDYIRKMLDLELRATKTETQLAALQSENDENRQEIQRLETEKAELEEEAKRLLGKETQIIRRGMLLYDQLLKSERVQTWTNSDYEAIAGFFEASHPDAMKGILKKYGRPTTRSMLYLILVDMGKSNDEICRIMSLNGSSLRSLKHRLRKNMEDSQ